MGDWRKTPARRVGKIAMPRRSGFARTGCDFAHADTLRGSDSVGKIAGNSAPDLAQRSDFAHPTEFRYGRNQNPSRDWTMIKITAIQPRGLHRLWLRFSDGSEGERDFSALVAEPGSLAKPLRDPA